MSYFHNRFNQVDRVAIYQFIKFLEDDCDYLWDDKVGKLPLGWRYRDEFVKLRQLVAFAYSHGMRD